MLEASTSCEDCECLNPVRFKRLIHAQTQHSQYVLTTHVL